MPAPHRGRSGPIIFLTCHLPYPPHSGGRRREYELLRRVAAEREVELYAVCKTPEPPESAQALAEYCSAVRVFAADPVAGGDELASVDRFRAHRARAPRRALRDRLARGPALLHVEGSYLMQHLPADAATAAVLTEQNVESSLWLQRANGAGGEERARRLRRHRRNREEEARWWRAAAACVAVCESDAAEIAARSGRRVVVVPDGFDHLACAAVGAPTRRDRIDVAMVANFDYEPNLDAAKYLVGEVLPRVRARVPIARFALVGNDPEGAVADLAAGAGVEATGWVESVEPYRSRARVIVAPHRVGGGVKVQVLECLARGLPLVATPVAIKGLPASARRELVSFEGPAELAAAVIRTLEDSAWRRELAARSRHAARRLPTWDEAAQTLLDVYAQAGAVSARAAA